MAEQTKEGRSSPLGATVAADGTNFCVYSKHATGIELLLFDCVDDARPKCVIPIDPITNRTYHYWHIFVPGVKAGQVYGYRAKGAFDPPSGMRFDVGKVLFNPLSGGALLFQTGLITLSLEANRAFLPQSDEGLVLRNRERP